MPLEDGSWDGEVPVGSCNISAEIDGKKMYNFNPETGILQISMSSSDLEILLQQVGEIPESGMDLRLQLPLPFGVDGPAMFLNVKRIESIPGVKRDHMFKYSPAIRALLYKN